MHTLDGAVPSSVCRAGVGHPVYGLPVLQGWCCCCCWFASACPAEQVRSPLRAINCLVPCGTEAIPRVRCSRPNGSEQKERWGRFCPTPFGVRVHPPRRGAADRCIHFFVELVLYHPVYGLPVLQGWCCITQCMDCVCCRAGAVPPSGYAACVAGLVLYHPVYGLSVLESWCCSTKCIGCLCCKAGAVPPPPCMGCLCCRAGAVPHSVWAAYVAGLVLYHPVYGLPAKWVGPVVAVPLPVLEPLVTPALLTRLLQQPRGHLAPTGADDTNQVCITSHPPEPTTPTRFVPPRTHRSRRYQPGLYQLAPTGADDTNQVHTTSHPPELTIPKRFVPPRTHRSRRYQPG